MASFEPLGAENGETGTTCLVVTAGIGLVDTLDRVRAELESGWRVQVVATPLAGRWLEAGGLSATIEELTGAAPESVFRNPWDSKKEAMANRCLASPVTLNTLTKWASGHPDNLALSMLTEATWSRGIPVTAQITLNGAYKGHPAGDPAIEVLREAGVIIEPYVAGPAMKEVLAATYQQNQLPRNLREG